MRTIQMSLWLLNKKKYDMYLICRRNDNKSEKKNETNILRNRKYKNPQKINGKFVFLFFGFYRRN